MRFQSQSTANAVHRTSSARPDHWKEAAGSDPPIFLLFTRLPVVSFRIVVVACALELRYHSAGDGFAFSFGLVLFVGVFAGLSMVEIENEQNSGSALRRSARSWL